MTEKKRIPPWERAYLSFKLAERKRLRELEEKNRPVRARQLDLEENRKREGLTDYPSSQSSGRPE